MHSRLKIPRRDLEFACCNLYIFSSITGKVQSWPRASRSYSSNRYMVSVAAATSSSPATGKSMSTIHGIRGGLARSSTAAFTKSVCAPRFTKCSPSEEMSTAQQCLSSLDWGLYGCVVLAGGGPRLHSPALLVNLVAGSRLAMTRERCVSTKLLEIGALPTLPSHHGCPSGGRESSLRLLPHLRSALSEG